MAINDPQHTEYSNIALKTKMGVIDICNHKNNVPSSLTNDVLFVLAWVAWLHGWGASVGGIGGVLAWVTCWCGWRASVGGLSGVLVWVAC